MTEAKTPPPPGWYAHEGVTQWWDGTGWTGHIQAAPVTSPVDDTRKDRLQRAVVLAVAHGGRIESQSDYTATIVYGSPPAHVVHAILSLVTFGLWLLVWLFAAMNASTRRQVITIDATGALTYTPPMWESYQGKKYVGPPQL